MRTKLWRPFRTAAAFALVTAVSAGLIACSPRSSETNNSESGNSASVAASSAHSSAGAEVTTVPRAAEVHAAGPVSAQIPPADPEVLLTDPRPSAGYDYQRILTLDRAGALSRVVYNLGLGERLVGRDMASDFPAIADLPNLTPGGHTVNPEAVLKLNPEVIITDGTIGPSRVFDTFEKAGVKVIRVADNYTPDTIPTLIDDVATGLGLADQAGAVADKVAADLAEATAYAQAKADGRSMMVLYVRGTGVAMIAGPKTGGRSLITRLGGVDAGAEVGIEGSFTPLTPEALIAAAPETIIVMSGGLESVGGVEGLLEVPGVAQTPAGKNRSILDVPDTQLLSFSSQTPRALRAMADALYGEEK